MSGNTPPSLPPNKLVKRSASLRSGTSSPVQNGSPGSRLPLPVFRRPATSHERSATLQERFLRPQSLGDRPQSEHDGEWRHYWTRKMAASDMPSGRRRHSTGIPNPIKRVYPDRKYTPILVSARDNVRQSHVEIDDSASVDFPQGALPLTFDSPQNAASSPLTGKSQQPLNSAPASHTRSFSISDVLSTGPKSVLRRSSTSKRTTPASKPQRTGRRAVSAPLSAMGGVFSSRTVDEQPERPSKRRETISSRTAQRDIHTSTGIPQPTHDAGSKENDPSWISDTASAQPSPYASSFNDAQLRNRTPSPDAQRQTHDTLDSTKIRPPRVSTAASEDRSLIESEGERRSLGAYSTDYGDNAWDSYPTRTTRSSSGRRGPPIDAIFDDSPPTYPSAKSTKLKDLLSDGSQMSSSHGLRMRHSTIQEEGSVTSTPPRTSHDNHFSSSPSARLGLQQLLPSSPPAMPDPDDINWDGSDDGNDDSGSDNDERTMGRDADTGTPTPQPGMSIFGDKVLPFRLSPFAKSQTGTSSSATSTPRRNGAASGPQERASIFDWSEQQPSPARPGNSSPPRPKTVHGKKEPDNRGSRSAGRRAPSGMHARSHSVPVAPDVEGKRSTVVANKFGTWGVGSKAVTEDWNDDFDFEDAPSVPTSASQSGDKRIDSGHEMFVPKSIREQQENVVANIGLLREWGLLIEELKELRIRAATLDVLKGTYEQDWSEVDAMIELADQESEEHTLEPRQSPPSSPSFDYDAFDEPVMANTGKPRMPSNKPQEPSILSPKPQKMTLSDDGEIFSLLPVATRPRKDSEAVARSVIEALQAKRSTPDSSVSPTRSTASSKVPFDTATLRHIVPYVHGLKRKVKDALREAEGLYSSPRRRHSPNTGTSGRRDGDEVPAFQTIFDEPHLESSPLVVAQDRARRQVTITDHDDENNSNKPDRSSSAQLDDDITKRMDSLSLSRDHQEEHGSES
ncbi:hypothetical protein K431DRAFT_221270 [Polychaeton citri CBS 116435]|uniref:Uncharacterized protein n=1 Tax=Polychaeton citri CBS 116435 TaxID=1314669 RepID=A0A9P4URL6_9PEZI|nr:hypothetical protein K431DRAFT_221270 [Polychaeton citri CBS 116435]